MKRIIFLNRFFFPDHSATSQLLSDLAFHLAASGQVVHVITSQQRYDNPGANLPASECVRGVDIHRVPTTRFGRSGLLGRSTDYVSYYAATRRALLALATSGDIIVAMTDPPLTSIVAMSVARRRKARLVHWHQDVYPEIAIELGVPLVQGPLGRALRPLRNRSLKAATLNVVVGEQMAVRIGTFFVPREQIRVIHNWVDDEQIMPVSHTVNPLRRQWGLEDRFVVGYSGNLGRAHEIETVLAAAQRLRGHPRIVFACIGGGHRFDELSSRVRMAGLEERFLFLPYQGHGLLKMSLAAADVHWVSLQPALEGLIVPSKFYGIAAAGRPVIAISARDGEIARLVEQHACGVVIEPGNGKALAETLDRLSQDASQVAAMGKNARTMLDARFTRRSALRQWRIVFEEIDNET